jgi:hypothetical protein
MKTEKNVRAEVLFQRRGSRRIKSKPEHEKTFSIATL